MHILKKFSPLLKEPSFIDDLPVVARITKFDEPTAKAFSSIVSGNVKTQGMAYIKEHGPFQIHGDKTLLKKLDVLLNTFLSQNRMKLPGNEYVPCYRVDTN